MTQIQSEVTSVTQVGSVSNVAPIGQTKAPTFPWEVTYAEVQQYVDAHGLKAHYPRIEQSTGGKHMIRPGYISKHYSGEAFDFTADGLTEDNAEKWARDIKENCPSVTHIDIEGPNHLWTKNTTGFHLHVETSRERIAQVYPGKSLKEINVPAQGPSSASSSDTDSAKVNPQQAQQLMALLSLMTALQGAGTGMNFPNFGAGANDNEDEDSDKNESGFPIMSPSMNPMMGLMMASLLGTSGQVGAGDSIPTSFSGTIYKGPVDVASLLKTHGDVILPNNLPPDAIKQKVIASARKYGVPDKVAIEVCRQESDFQHEVSDQNSGGSFGPMQWNYNAEKGRNGVGFDRDRAVRDIDYAIDGGMRELARDIHTYGLRGGLHAFNGSWGYADRVASRIGSNAVYG